MPLSIRNADTVALAREVATRKGTGVTEAIHAALENEKAKLQPLPKLRPETEAFLKEHYAKLRASSTCSRIVDKAFFDSLYDE